MNANNKAVEAVQKDDSTAEIIMIVAGVLAIIIILAILFSSRNKEVVTIAEVISQVEG